MKSKKHYRINVLFVSQPYFIGGVERYLLSCVSHLKPLGMNPVVIFNENGPAVDMLKKRGVKIGIIKNKGWANDRFEITKICKYFSIDLVDMMTMKFFNVSLVAKKLNIPVVWHISSILKTTYPKLKQRDIIKVLKTVYAISGKIVVNSKAVAGQFNKRFRDKIETIYPGVDTNYFLNQESLPILAEFKKKNILMGIAGRLDPQKRHEDFILAARDIKRQIPNVKFLIAGSYSTKSYLRHIKNLVNRLNLNKEILFLDFCEDMKQFYGAIDILVHPAVDEGFGLAIVEAMAMGKPVVASRSGGIPEIITDGETGILVPPKRPDKISEAVLRLIRDDKKAKQISKNARRVARKRFDIKISAEKTRSLYDEVISSCKNLK